MELLVTVGLMVVLASVLVGVVHRAARSADQVRNVNNLRQLGVASLLYANDHDRVFPLHTPGGRRQATCSYDLAGGSVPRKLMTGFNGIGQGTQDYIANPDVFYSPHARRIARERQPGQFYRRPGGSYLIGYLFISMPRKNEIYPEIPPLVPGLYNERLDDPGSAPLYCDFINVLAVEEEFRSKECTFVLKDGSVKSLKQSELRQSWSKNIQKMAEFQP